MYSQGREKQMIGDLIMRLKLDYIVALTNLYGVVHKEKVVEIYNMQNKDQIEISEIEAIADRNEEELEKQFTFIDGDYFVTEAIIIFDECDFYLQEKEGKPYYIPNKRQLLRYKDNEYFEKTKEYKKLFKFIKNHLQMNSPNSVEDICIDIVVNCQLDLRPTEIINDLQRLGITFDTQQQLSEAMHLITDVSNNTRRWVNNGYTPKELYEYYEESLPNNNTNANTRIVSARENNRQQPVVKAEKIGRNDPCPCGSGQKYKRCCL